MQERYLGDSHDFLKYSLLGHLSTATGVRLGANWYLTVPEQVDKAGNNDGQKRHHLKGGVWQHADPDLLERIQKFDPVDSRSLPNVAEWGLLPPNTVYYDAPVSTANQAGWHGIGAQTLRESDLVFLDPDNGLEVKSMTSRTRPKYALTRRSRATSRQARPWWPFSSRGNVIRFSEPGRFVTSWSGYAGSAPGYLSSGDE